jgi:hypothetical protein
MVIESPALTWQGSVLSQGHLVFQDSSLPGQGSAKTRCADAVAPEREARCTHAVAQERMRVRGVFPAAEAPSPRPLPQRGEGEPRTA